MSDDRSVGVGLSRGPFSSRLLRIGVGAIAVAAAALGQPSRPENGPRRIDPSWHALVHATAIPAPGEKIEDATIVIRDGVIQAIGAGAAPPAGARVWDSTGLTIYAGLIEPYAPVEAPKPDASMPGRHWNPNVMAERSALDGAGLDASARKSLRGQGFVAAAVAPSTGVIRGTGAVVSLAEPADSSDELPRVIRMRQFHTISIDVPGRGDRQYPSSKMGAIALVRQTLADAPWYERALRSSKDDPSRFERPAPNDSAAALNEPLPLLFDVSHEQDALRVAKIATEFSRPAMIVGCGTEFRRLDPIVALRLPLIVPLAYPDKPTVTTLADRESVGLRELMAWEAGPTNAARIVKAGIPAALTTAKLPKGQEFFSNLRQAIKAGLTEDQALAMLTTAPAEMLGLTKTHGTIEPGKAASFVVVKGPLFDKDREIRDVWIDGARHEIKPAPRIDLEGSWEAEFVTPTSEGQPSPASFSGTLKVEKKNDLSFERATTEQDRAREKAEREKKKQAEGEKPDGGAAQREKAEGEAKKEPEDKPTRVFKARGVTVDENRIDFAIEGAAFLREGTVLLSAVVDEGISGTGTLPDGTTFSWSARRTEAKKADEKKDEEDTERFVGIPEKFGMPFGAFAFDEPPPARVAWIEKATIWTSGPEGILENATLHVADGKVVGVYAAGQAPRIELPEGTMVLDAKGKHITPGLIDCHSHTGIMGGVNEGTQSCTAEVRIFDVIDPDAIGWYRELAGGLTGANQLHGSANSIGGQNSVVKLRWGVSHPDEMSVEGAIPGIKFALGENVKQSNWGENSRDRYPQTRMGVESYIRDRFTAAREYAAARRKDASIRRDLELEALAEILAGERLVHCHSYRQDEILMLCRVAKDFGFKIGTFQHVLEGYKVAEAIRENAIGGSAFSDWWAYKFEVVDAIPSGGAVMHDAGVTVSFNSDSDELARRMNIEAAKAVKYGGVPREEAIKFVTLNAAKQLKIDGRTGSLEAGKDADFVIWSGDPFSTLTKCEATYIDGREYFSLGRDAVLRAIAAAERNRILQKLVSKPKGDEMASKGEDRKAPRRASEQIDDPPPTMFMGGTASDDGPARGLWMVPVGDGDIEAARELAFKRSLERHYMWLITNGLDPSSNHAGDCGCGIGAYFGN